MQCFPFLLFDPFPRQFVCYKSRFYGIYPNFNVDIAGQAPQTIALTHCNLCIDTLFSPAKSILLTLILQIGAKLFLISVKNQICVVLLFNYSLSDLHIYTAAQYILCTSWHMRWCPCWNTSLCCDTMPLFKMYQLLHSNVINLMTAEWLPTIMLAESLKLDD